jgi:hypothetical protein
MQIADNKAVSKVKGLETAQRLSTTMAAVVLAGISTCLQFSCPICYSYSV